MVRTVNKRTTLIVSDMKRSRAFYQDCLGMTVYYDDEVIVSGDGLPAGEPGSKTHLIILKCQDPVIGMIGLLEFLEPRLPEPPQHKERVGIGDTVFVMDVDDVDTVYERLVANDFPLYAAPHEWEIRAANGQIKRMKSVSLFDPDGYFVELNMTLS